MAQISIDGRRQRKRRGRKAVSIARGETMRLRFKSGRAVVSVVIINDGPGAAHVTYEALHAAVSTTKH